LTASNTRIIDDVSDGLVGFASAEFASAGLGNVVGVVSSSVFTTTGDDGVLVSIIGPATVTAVVVVGAGSGLLNTEGLKGGNSLQKKSVRFNGFSGRVSPARTALALIFYGGDDATVSPVNISIGSNRGERSDRFEGEVFSLIVERTHEQACQRTS